MRSERERKIAMAEVKDFLQMLKNMQQAQNAADLTQTKAQQLAMEGKIQQIQYLTEQVRCRFEGVFIAPRIPESDPPEQIVQQALSYMENDKNYNFLLRPSGLFRKAQESDYQMFLTYAEAARRFYQKQEDKLKQAVSQGETAFSDQVRRYSEAVKPKRINTNPQDQYRPAGTGSGEIYLGDVEESLDQDDTVLEQMDWVEDGWAWIPFCYQASKPFTLFIDAADHREFDALYKQTGQILRGVMYQILRAMPAYTYQFYVIDLKKAAGFLEELQILSRVINNSAYSLDENVCHHRYQMLKIATTQEQASQMLRDLDEWMGKVTSLCAGEGTLVDYNAHRLQDGVILEGQQIVPQLFVILENVHGAGGNILETIKRLVVNSMQCGISVIVTSGRAADEELDKEEKELKQVISDWLELSEGDCVAELSAASLGEPKTKEILRSHFQFVPWLGQTPDLPFLNAIRAGLRPNINVETAMEKRLDFDAIWGKGNGDREIVLPVGVNEQGKVTTIAIGGPDGAHALLAGSTGCGKSTLLHDIINGVIICYKPEDVQLWLSDYKLNEFQRYAEDTPPHIKFIGISRSKEYSLGFIEKIHGEMERRQQLFGKITSLKEYREVYGPDSMPRILIVIDEFHKMSDHVRDEPEHKQMLTNILKEARSVGISLLLSDQTCGIGLKGLSEEGKEQLTLRMSMRSSYEEYNAVMGISNAREVRELKALRRWEVTLKRIETFENDEGEEEVRSYFEWNRTLYLSNEMREAIAQRSIRDYGPCTDVQIVRSGVRVRPDWEDIKASAVPAKRHSVNLYLGVPTSLDKYLVLTLRTNFEENIMCIGDDDVRLLSMMESILASIDCAGEDYEAYILIDAYEPMFYEGEMWLQKLAQQNCRIHLCIGEEEVCRAVAGLTNRMDNRMHQRGNKERILMFWIGLAGLMQSLSTAGRECPEALLEQLGLSKHQKSSSLDGLVQQQNADDAFSKMFQEFEDLLHTDEQEDNHAEESEAGEDETKSPLLVYDISDDVQKLVRMGPRQSLISVVFHSSVSALRRTPGIRQDDFRHRIGFGLGSDDALLFLNSSKAIKDAEGNLMDASMAVYYDGRTYRQFAPFIGDQEMQE